MTDVMVMKPGAKVYSDSCTESVCSSKGIGQFRQHQQMFRELTDRQDVSTEYNGHEFEVITIYLKNNYALVLCQEESDLFALQVYSLKQRKRLDQVVFRDNKYLRMNSIELSRKDANTDTLAIAMQDDGRFKVNFYRLSKGKLDAFNDLDVTAILGLDDKSKPITGWWEPLITTCFTSN